MSPAQQKVVRVLDSQLRDPHTSNRRVLIQAGTGKSTFIRAMCRMLDGYANLNGLDKMYEVVAPTGAAAVNIDGIFH